MDEDPSTIGFHVVQNEHLIEEDSTLKPEDDSQSQFRSPRDGSSRGFLKVETADVSQAYEPTDYADVSPGFSGSSTPPYMRWAVDLYHLLEDYEGVNLFRQYLLLESCDNMIEFWFACKALKRFSPTETDKIQSVGRAIYNKYIRSHGERSLQLLPSSTRVDISKKVVSRKDFKQSTFDSALRDIERELYTRHAAFVRSDVYIRHVQVMQKTETEGSLKGSHESSSSSSNSGDDNSRPPAVYLPTVHEESEESGNPDGDSSGLKEVSSSSVAADKTASGGVMDTSNRVLAGCPSPAGTRSPLSGSMRKRIGGGRLTAPNLHLSSAISSKNQSANAAMIMPPNPYHTKYVPFLPGSAQDSELQSLSSDADTLSMTTDSSIDVFPMRSSKKQLQKQQLMKRRSAMANKDSDLSQTVIPRTQRPLSREVLMPPEEFLHMLCEKLKKVQKEQEERERLNESLRKLSEVDSSNSNATTRRDAVLQYCRSAAISGEEEHMMILDEHVSRVWESPKQSPLRSPGPGYMRKMSPGSKSPDRAAKMMTNSYPFPQRSHNQQLIVNQVSSGGIFSKLNDSTSSKTKPHYAKGSKPTPVAPPNPYRIPKLIPTDQPSTSGFQPCLSPLVDKKINNTQQLWKSKRPAFSDTSGIESGASSVASSSKIPSNSQDRVYQWMMESDKQTRSMAPIPATHKTSASKGLSVEAPVGSKSRNGTTKVNLNESSSAPQTLKRSSGSRKVEASPPGPTANLSVDNQEYLIVGYNLPNEQVPFLTKFPGRQITLKQFKQLITRKGTYKYYFKCASNILGTGVVFCEMVRFKAIQDESSDSEPEDVCFPTKEAASLIVTAKYNEVMKQLSGNNLDPRVVCSMLESVLELFNDHFSDVSRLVEADRKIPYLVHKNLAKYNLLAGRKHEALESYSKVVEIDPADWMSWKKLGDLAFDPGVDNLRLARFAYQKCLAINRNFRGCSDSLMEVLWLLEDFPGCLAQIYSTLLVDPAFMKGIYLKKKILAEQPYMRDFIPDQLRSSSHLLQLSGFGSRIPREKIPALDKWFSSLCQRKLICINVQDCLPCCPSTSLSECSIKGVGEAIAQLHSQIVDGIVGETQAHLSPIDLRDWITTAISVSVNSVLDSMIDRVEGSLETQTLDYSTGVLAEWAAIVGLFDDASVGQVDEVDMVGTSSESETFETQSPTKSGDTDNRTPQKSKQKDQNHIDSNLLTRRSTRRIPGFSLPEEEEPFFIVKPPLPPKEQLLNCFPPPIKEKLKSCESSNVVQISPVASGRQSSSAVVRNVGRKFQWDVDLERRKAEEFLVAHDGQSVWDLLCSWLEMVESSRLYQYWDTGGLLVFLDCFKRWKSSQTETYCDESDRPVLTSDRLDLLFCEIFFKLLSLGDGGEPIPDLCDLYHKTLGYLSFYFGPMHVSDCQNAEFLNRVHWLLANSCLNVGKFLSGANFARMLLEDHGSSWTDLVVVNNKVMLADVERLCSTLDRKMKLKSVREMIADGELDTVSDTLNGTIASAKEPAEFEDLLEHIMALAEAFGNRNVSNQQLRWLRKGLNLVGLIFGLLHGDESAQFLKQSERLMAAAVSAITDASTDDSCLSEIIAIAKVSMDLILWALERTEENLFIGKSVLRCASLWILLYSTAKRLESEYLVDDQYIKEWHTHVESNKSFMATRSLMILLFAHERLGKIHSCTGEDGRLLVFFVDEILKCLRDERLSNLTPTPCQGDMLNVAEQNFFCLYEYPNKRKRHLVDHYAPAAQLTWDRIVTLFDFVKPSEAPEFDDKTGCERRQTISSDDEILLRRIESLMPQHLRSVSDSILPVIQQYLQSSEWNQFEQLPQEFTQTPVVSELYHLLADYHLKSTKNDAESERYYLLDLCVNRNRFDSWAGLAIIKGKQLAAKFGLDGSSFKESDRKKVLLDGYSCLKCFQKAVALMDSHETLWVEYGTTAYQLHSYVSRALKRSLEMSESDRRTLLKQKRQYLQDAKTAFEKAHLIANGSNFMAEEKDHINKEEWLHNYMLGKISEKLKHNPFKTLDFYHNATNFLHKEGAKYPDKIRYQSPAKYSLEALEVFYRAHVCVVKYLLSGRHTCNATKLLEKLQWFRYSPISIREFGKSRDPVRLSGQIRMTTHADVVNAVDSLMDIVCEKTDATSNIDVEEDSTLAVMDLDTKIVTSLLSSMVDKVVESETELQVMQLCIEAFQLVNRRFPNHHKSLCWLGRIFIEYSPLKNLATARTLLFGPPGAKFHIPQALFQDRRPVNFFNGIFRVPADDIDRPGSFPAHMYRTVEIAIGFLLATNDRKLLVELYCALKVQKPEVERRYLHNWDRLSMLQKCHLAMSVIIRKKWESLKGSPLKEMKDFLLEVHCLFNTCDKTKDLGCFIDTLTSCHQAITGANGSKTPKKDALSYCTELIAERQRENLKIARQKRAKLALMKRQAMQACSEKASAPVRSVNITSPSSSVWDPKRPRIEPQSSGDDPLDVLLKAIGQQKKLPQSRTLPLLPSWTRTPVKPQSCLIPPKCPPTSSSTPSTSTATYVSPAKSFLSQPSPSKLDVLRMANGFPLSPQEMNLYQNLFAMNAINELVASQLAGPSACRVDLTMSMELHDLYKQPDMMRSPNGKAEKKVNLTEIVSSPPKEQRCSTWNRSIEAFQQEAAAHHQQPAVKVPETWKPLSAPYPPANHTVKSPNSKGARVPGPTSTIPKVSTSVGSRTVSQQKLVDRAKSSGLLKTNTKPNSIVKTKSAQSAISAAASPVVWKREAPKSLPTPTPSLPSFNQLVSMASTSSSVAPGLQMAKPTNSQKIYHQRPVNAVRQTPYARPTVPKSQQSKGYQYGKNIVATIAPPSGMMAKQMRFRSPSVTGITGSSQDIRPTSSSSSIRSNFNSVDFLAASSVRPDATGSLKLPLIRDSPVPGMQSVSGGFNYNNCPLPTMPQSLYGPGQMELNYAAAQQLGLVPKLPVPPLKNQMKQKSFDQAKPGMSKSSTQIGPKPLKPLAVKPSSNPSNFSPYSCGLDSIDANLMKTVASQLERERESAAAVQRRQKVTPTAAKPRQLCTEIIDLASD